MVLHFFLSQWKELKQIYIDSYYEAFKD